MNCFSGLLRNLYLHWILRNIPTVTTISIWTLWHADFHAHQNPSVRHTLTIFIIVNFKYWEVVNYYVYIIIYIYNAKQNTRVQQSSVHFGIFLCECFLTLFTDDADYTTEMNKVCLDDPVIGTYNDMYICRQLCNSDKDCGYIYLEEMPGMNICKRYAKCSHKVTRDPPTLFTPKSWGAFLVWACISKVGS